MAVGEILGLGLAAVEQPGQPEVGHSVVQTQLQRLTPLAHLGVIDGAMVDDYASGDPYVAFARRGQLIPPNGTRDASPRAAPRPSP